MSVNSSMKRFRWTLCLLILEGKCTVFYTPSTQAHDTQNVALYHKRSSGFMDNELKSIGLHKHGASKKISSESEFKKGQIKQFLAAYNIALAERPVRRHNKTGIARRKSRVTQIISERLQHKKSISCDVVVLFRATFLSNFFCRKNLLSDFELVREYTPALLGFRYSLGFPELLEAYENWKCIRMLQRLLRSIQLQTMRPELPPSGTPIRYYYKSLKHCESAEWRSDIALSDETFVVQIRNGKWLVSNVAYEVICLEPKLPFKSELAKGLVKDYLSGMDKSMNACTSPDSNRFSVQGPNDAVSPWLRN